MFTQRTIAGLIIWLLGCSPATAPQGSGGTGGDTTGEDTADTVQVTPDTQSSDTVDGAPDTGMQDLGNTTGGTDATEQCEAFFAWNGSACEPVCGDGQMVGNEACDDGNTLAGDGCRADCRGLEECGDGLLDNATDEECDDGNEATGDGCDDRCELEPFEGPCGDGVVNIGEECDDGNNADLDGCEDCAFAISDQWTCDPSLFHGSDGCECGCGQVDPDCENTLSASCDFCGGIGSCNPNDLACQQVNPTNNAICK